MARGFRLCVVLAVSQLLTFLAVPLHGQSVDNFSPWTNAVTGFAPDVSLADDWNAIYPQYEGMSPLPADNSGATGSDGPDDGGLDTTNSTLAPRASKDFYLRVMPLGASITQGFHSKDNNGYRKWIRQQLRWQGWKVNSKLPLRCSRRMQRE